MGSSKRGSTNESSNLVSLCEPCHRWIESRRIEAFAEGYLLSQSAEPSASPIKIRGDWYLLDDRGGKTRQP